MVNSKISHFQKDNRTNSISPISSIKSDVLKKIKELNNTEVSLLENINKLDPLSGLKKVLDLDIYKEFICSIILEENNIETNQYGMLYNIYVDDLKYNVEILKENNLPNGKIGSLFNKKINQLVSVTMYKEKIYVIYF